MEGRHVARCSRRGLRPCRRRRGRACPTTRRCARYGSDRPDTRFGLEIARRRPGAARARDFKVFEGVLDGGGVVRAINAGAARAVALRARRAQRGRPASTAARPSRRSSPGTARGARRSRSSSRRSRSRRSTRELAARRGDLLLFVADSARIARRVARRPAPASSRERFGLIPEGRHDLLWIVDFPMFECDEDGEHARWDALHHPFTAPQGDLRRPRRAALARLRPRARRHRDRRRLDPHPHPEVQQRGASSSSASPEARRTSASASCSTR